MLLPLRRASWCSWTERERCGEGGTHARERERAPAKGVNVPVALTAFPRRNLERVARRNVRHRHFKPIRALTRKHTSKLHTTQHSTREVPEFAASVLLTSPCVSHCGMPRLRVSRDKSLFYFFERERIKKRLRAALYMASHWRTEIRLPLWLCRCCDTR